LEAAAGLVVVKVGTCPRLFLGVPRIVPVVDMVRKEYFSCCGQVPKYWTLAKKVSNWKVETNKPVSVDRETGWFDFGRRMTELHMWLDHQRRVLALPLLCGF